MDIFSINKNQTFLIYVLYKSLLKLTILSNVSSRCSAPRAMLLMLARQQAYSSYGGFAKLASFFFPFFLNIFLALRVGSPLLFIFFFFFFFFGGGGGVGGSQGCFGHSYGLGVEGWDLVKG